MQLRTWLKLILFFTVAISIVACGGGSNGTNNSDGKATGYLMGGAVQGKTLNLTGMVTTMAGSITGAFGSSDGVGTTAGFYGPSSITTDGTNLYLVDTTNSTIRKIKISTGAVTTLAGTAGAWGSANGIGAAASFMFPCGITTDGTNLYVADTNNHAIRKIVISTGVVTTLAGTIGNFGSVDGIGTAASFDWPQSITTDGTYLYVSDTGNNTIRKIAIASGVVTTLAGTAGNFGSADGVGASASFSRPYGITTDGTNLYVMDAYNYTIRKIVISSGTVTTLAGTAGIVGSTDGIGPAASFKVLTSSITTDGTSLYVSDKGNNTIRKIAISSGAVTTLAGTAGIIGSADGIGVSASFNSLYGITTDGTNLYISDYFNNSIRKLH